MATNFRFSEPTNVIDVDTRSYLNELIRDLESFDQNIFSQETGLVFEAARRNPFVTTSASYSMGPFESVLLADSNGSTICVSVPDVDTVKGCFIFVKKIDSNAATVVSVEGQGVELPYVLSGTSKPSVRLFSDGNSYWVF